MGLSAGTRLGPYEIVSALGAGGMGEVYRARDTRLERTVAIKVLNASLTASPELKARFEREARAISQLNHPNICTLHDVGHDGGTDYLVMEFIDGESLAARIQRGPVALKELLAIAIDTADALDKAHRAGIVHRDLKPGNIMLTKSGAKLLDFGLAKPFAAVAGAASSASAPAFTAAATLSSPAPSPLTAHGSIVGTIQYMSPEQIQGLEADARSDIFAFGSMLYEMASGKRPFEGKSQLKIASAILEDQAPALSTLPNVPPPLDRLITTCLSKDPGERFQCAHDLKLELVWMQRELGSGPTAKPGKAKSAIPMTLVAAAAALLLVAVAVFAYLRTPASMSIEAYILPPEKMSFTLGGDDASGPVKLSPDGTKIVFVAQDGRSQRQVYVRGIDDKEAKPIPGTENGTYPFWSPDGKNIAFQSNGMLHRVAVNGGPVLDICQSQRFRGGSWGAEGIVFTPDTTTTIFHVAPNAGATPQPVTTLSADHTTHRWPTLLPDGKHFLYLASNHSDPRPNDRNGIYFGSIDGKESHFIVGAHSNAAYANGLLLWEQDGSLLAQKFDAKAGRVSGEVIPLVSGIGYNSSTWRAAFDVNPNGVLVYQPGLSASSGQLMIYDAEGHSKAVADSGAIMDLRLSPDGRRAVVLTRTADHGLWILDLDKGTRTRFTFSSTNDGVVWSPDGKYVYYTPFGKTSRIVRKATDGTGEEATVFESPGPLHVSDISRDGKTILFEQRYGNLSSTTMVLPLSPLGTPRPLSKDPVGTHYARFSPDGKWVIYCTTETSRFEVYIAPLEGGSRQQLSTGGGWGPRWSRDGKSIYYVNGERNLTVLPISIKGNAIEAGQSRLMFVLPALVPTSFFAMSIDASTDGKRFVANVTGENDDESRAILMTNWPAKLKK